MPSLRPSHPLLHPCRCLLLALGLLAGAGPAAAQIGLPQLPGGLPARLGDSGMLRDRLRERLLDTAELPGKLPLDQLRQAAIGDLMQRHRAQLEADPSGLPIVRREILAWSPSAAGLAAAAAAGLEVASRREMAEIGQVLLALRVPEGVATADALAALRAADPDGVYDFNHVYTGAAAGGSGAAAMPAAGTGAGGGGRIGLVDSGVDERHEVFREARIVHWGCDGAAMPAPHGTAVAALMVGRSGRFSGAAPGATLYAADIYCDQPTGGSASQIVQALAWLAKEQVGVINISLVGPPNQMLGRAVQAMLARGHLLVAAVGNDGPAAPPLYPASYPGVVGVTGVDPKRRPLPEAARGPQVMFAAPGSQMAAAAIGSPPYKLVRGTSFAAPLVAALLAPKLPSPSVAQAAQALSWLTAAATPGGEGTGRGLVGENLRVAPSAFR
ncbi:S8 family serine peptidase [Pseudoduganella violaceinigra]|uniref:S8 family serine peptidase n=1 Tax=Pseudoduganella violaceinigra TaxID=246602 RepID=UPI0009FD40C4|nr:S8 family serine peptidase [Pseudoduganella violaceinigra]